MIQTETDYISIPLEGWLYTNRQGIGRLLNWYASVSEHHNTKVYTCCRNLKWLDANLAALWSALMYKLQKENNLQFQMDESSLASRFSILIRNGFTQTNTLGSSLYKTFIRNASFGPEDEEAFSAYISGELMKQKQIRDLPPQLQGLLEGNLYELYCNVYKHASTSYPFFICGQYYHSRSELRVSLVDLGQTFLPAIQHCTNGTVTTQKAAIEWAVSGKSELGAEGGGHALKCMKSVFTKGGHALQIVTGNAFWDSSHTFQPDGAHRVLPNEMPGTMVSFILSTKLSP